MRNFSFSLTLISVLITLISCNKAGTGGKAELSASVKHHDLAIPAATVYVKFNAKEFPGEDVSKYDLVAVTGTSGHAKGHAHIKDLKQGYYYLYGVGYDSTISEKVTGGIGVRIKYSQRKEDIEITVPVTE